MATYHLQAKVIARKPRDGRPGRSVVAAAAYRAAEALHDAQLGRMQNYLGKQGVVHSEILLPTGAAARWADRETLWNEVTAGERRHDAQLAREIELALPRELSQADAIALARAFVAEQFVAYGMVADLNVHLGRAADGGAQPHAHVLLTMREVVAGPDGGGAFGRKEVAWNRRELLGVWRERWAELANARLAEAGHDARIDHRSNFARGIDLEPQHKIGATHAQRAARGEEARRAEEHRAIARRNGARIAADPVLALAALTLQQSTFTRADLARFVHRHSDGAAQFAQVLARVEASPELVRVGHDHRGEARWSTRELVAVEAQLVATAATLAERFGHPPRRLGQALPASAGALSEEQQAALTHVLRARDLAVVVGIAGGGKSTLLGAAREAWEAQGYRVRGAALAGIAAEGLEGSAGIASRTIASWEYAWAAGQDGLTARDVLVLDEAGMVGSRQLGRVVAAVAAAGAKLVLVGDAEQLQAIEAGAAFRAIADRVGAVAITEPRRQVEAWQRAATLHLARRYTGDALAAYAAAGMVERHATREAARAGLIAGWDAARRAAPEGTQLILAHERADVRALNDAARAVRLAAGELGAGQALPTATGLRALAVGDRVYFLRNERDLGVRNGSLGTVAAIEGEGAAARLAVRLDGPAERARTVRFALAEYDAVDHGYAATIHRNQGTTVDEAHVLATPGMDRHLAYVALTRHRHAVRLHWGVIDFGEYGPDERLSRERAKDTTLDYANTPADPVAAYAARRDLVPEPAAAPAPVPIPTPSPAALPSPPEPTRPGAAEPAVALPERLTPLPPRHAFAATPAGLPGPPATAAKIAVAVNAYPDVQDARYRLRQGLEWVWRDPAEAAERLKELVRSAGGHAQAASVLEQDGPELLGKLRGGQGLFASAAAKEQRARARALVGHVGRQLRALGDVLARTAAVCRWQDEERRAAMMVAVPGLSEPALRAVEAFEAAGVRPAWLAVPLPSAKAASADEVALAARVRAVWDETTTPNVRAELEEFLYAANRRWPEDAGHDVVDLFYGASRARRLGGVLQAAKMLDRRHTEYAKYAEAEAARQAETAYHAERAAQEAREAAARRAGTPLPATTREEQLQQARGRLLGERLDSWMREKHGVLTLSPPTPGSAGRRDELYGIQEVQRITLRKEIAKLPESELQKAEARWARDDLHEALQRGKQQQWSSRPSSGPSM